MEAEWWAARPGPAPEAVRGLSSRRERRGPCGPRQVLACRPASAGSRRWLGQSLHFTFWAVLLTVVLTLLLATLVPAVAVTKWAEATAAEQAQPTCHLAYIQRFDIGTLVI